MSRTEAQKRADRAREKRGRPGWSGLLRLSPEHDAKLQQIMLPDETRQESIRRLIEKETKMETKGTTIISEQQPVFVICVDDDSDADYPTLYGSEKRAYRSEEKAESMADFFNETATNMFSDWNKPPVYSVERVDSYWNFQRLVGDYQDIDESIEA